LRQSKQCLAKCYVIAFEKRGTVADATITPPTLNFLNKLVATFGIGVENVNSSVNLISSSSTSIRLASTIQDPVFQKMKEQFTQDFDFSSPSSKRLQNLIDKLKKWIYLLQNKTKALAKSILIEDKCRFLSNFSQHTAEIELPGEFLLPKHAHYYVKISRFMPRVDIVHKHNTAARRLHIRGHNGKIYPYLIVNDCYIGDARREERVLQLLRMLNHYLGKQKETSSRFLHITVPRVVAVSPQLRLVEDNPASLSLLEIYKEECGGSDPDAPIARYYERLEEIQASAIQPSHHVLKELFRDIQNKYAPKTMLKEWALRTFSSTTDFWTFRKMMTLQLSLACFVEYVFHLTRLNPDMMYLHKDSGLINISYYKFDNEDITGEMDRSVKFRLTPNLIEFISNIGVKGPMTASGIAAARCLVQPGFKIKTILRTILRDEIMYRQKNHGDRSEGEVSNKQLFELEGKLAIDGVNNAVNAILQRLQSLSQFEGTDSKMATLIAVCSNEDNLCRMDPAWHPWL